MNPLDWTAIVDAMRAGGFYDRIMAAKPELDRVKDYLRAFAGERDAACRDAAMNPKYPCFPGLRHSPFHDSAGFAPVAALERAWTTIRDEALALDEAHELDYTMTLKPLARASRAGDEHTRNASPGAWTVYPFWHMGVNVESITRRCPRTMALIESLPGLCVDYPWGDALFSVQGPQSSLHPHCSVDNLRLRCHLGIRIPDGTGIRVATQTRTWTEGRCLLFEDSYEHEVWNRSHERRIVLIVDFWHPDLTPIEVQALTAGFMKREVRELFFAQRIRMTSSPDTYLPYLKQSIREQEAAPLLRQFWNA
jgi:aspartyl/asparaginyl beta-hydroxylase (cupin superfamily)